MSAFMVVYMNITDSAWVDDYFKAVPGLLAEFGARSFAGGRNIQRLEGSLPVPERIALLEFPSLVHIEEFMQDARYQPFRQARKQGAVSDIFVFENEVTDGELR
jgi:uncharacterized protein (DUF1330 family)